MARERRQASKRNPARSAPEPGSAAPARDGDRGGPMALRQHLGKEGNQALLRRLSSLSSAPAAGAGVPLAPPLRAEMQERFEADFSRVRVHADAPAARSATALRARAYARGQDLFFSEGEYRPDSLPGRRLIAHELAHVVQQRAAQGGPSRGMTRPGDAAERDAHQAAARAIRGEPARVALSTPILIARQERVEGEPPPGSALAQVISALNRRMEVAGVGDYPEAFRILNGLSMRELLQVLAGLARRYLLDLLAGNIESAAGVDRARIETAISAVRLRPPDSPAVTASRVGALGAGYGALPADQQADIREYLSGSRDQPLPAAPPPNLTTTGTDAFEPGLVAVTSVSAVTSDPLWVENDIASATISPRAPWTYTIVYNDRARLTIPLAQFFDRPLANPVRLYRRHRATQRLIPFIGDALDPAVRAGGSGATWQERLANAARPRFDPTSAPNLCARLNQDQIIGMAIGVLHVLEWQLANPVVAGGVRPGAGGGSLGRAGGGAALRALGGRGGGRAAVTFVEIGAGDLQASIRLARQGVRVVAVDTAQASAAAVRELESLGGTFIRGQAADVAAGTADHVFQYFPWRIGGAGRTLGGGTWRLIQDAIRLLRPNGAAHFVTEDLATARFLVEEASRRGLRAVLTETTAGAAAQGAAGAGVPGFSATLPVWQINIYL